MIIQILVLSHLVFASENTGSGEKVKQKAKETIDATKDYVHEKKESFVERMKKELARLDAALEELGRKISSKSDKVKEESKETLQDLAVKRDQIKDDLKKAGKSSNAAFKELEVGIGKAVGELDTSIKAARKKLSDD